MVSSYNGIQFDFPPAVEFSIMCGRFTLRTSADALAKYFLEATIDVSLPFLKPRFNIAPTQMIAALRSDEQGAAEYHEFRWGLIPSWAKDAKIGYTMINARGETIAEKPAFRAAFKRRRCLIPADGFYEWKAVGKLKKPSYIYATDDRPFCFAGLWEYWESPEAVIESATIVTTSANDFMRDLHDRMPVILKPSDFRSWLDVNTSVDELKELIRPIDNDFLTRHEVATTVNSAKQDQASFIEPLPVDLFGE
jgi:putative SOS response-associated peptidase YedK